VRETQDYASLQCWATNNQTNSLTTSKHSIEFICIDFPCHLKVNRGKLALINCRWKCEKGKRLMITANSFMKIDQHEGFRLLWQGGWEISACSRNQSECRICWIPPARELIIIYCLFLYVLAVTRDAQQMNMP